MPATVKSALVTGGGRGLGRAIALKLAEAGMRVGVLARTGSEVEATAAQIREAGGEARAFVADVLDPPRLRLAVAQFGSWAGGLDSLICSAGRLRGIGPLVAAEPEEWWRDLETSLKGVPSTIREAYSLLKSSPHASISVLVGPGHANNFPFASGYAAAQAGLVRLVECLEAEMRADRIRVYAVNPGLVPTTLVQHVLDSVAGRRWLPGITEAFAEGKEVGPEVVAETTAWLVEERPSELSGRVVPALALPAILESRLARIEAEDLLRLRLH